MRAHFSVVHEDYKPYYCSECQFRAPKSFRVTAHIEKNHGGIGEVLHDPNLKPRPVSPPAPEVMIQAKKDSIEYHDGIDRIDNLTGMDTDEIGTELSETASKQHTKLKVKIKNPHKFKPPTPVIMEQMENTEPSNETSDESESDEEVDDSEAFFFHCPYCEFKSDIQITICDHVIINHTEKHIARNAQMAT